MNWESVSAFIAMGGYGGFVWGSYGITAACFAIEIWLLLARQRRVRRQLLGQQ
jgi:heme exporter protein D